MKNQTTLDPFTQAYIIAALWSSTVEDPDDEPGPNNRGGIPMDDHYSADDLSPETVKEMEKDCAEFQAKCAAAGVDFDAAVELELREFTATEYAGHNFWLNRNGHGVGFWDGDWKEPQATELDKLAKSFGTCYLYVGDDGMIYQS